MQNVVSTQGADGDVKSLRIQGGTGLKSVLLPTLTGNQKYRVVGGTVSLSATGQFVIYHGTAYNAAKAIASGYVAGNTPIPLNLGDWAAKVSGPNDPVQIDVTAGAFDVTLQYQVVS